MKTLAILTNGGDTCALNASIKSIRDNAYKAGYKKIYGIRRGYQGLLDGWIDDITHKEIDVHKGGSCLGAMRVSPVKPKGKVRNRPRDKRPARAAGAAKSANRQVEYEVDDKLCRRMAACLADYHVDVLVVIGGDGTLQATRLFQQWIHAEKLYPFNLIGFLKTIDNDIRTHTFFEGIEVALCPGFPSAVQKIVSAVEDLRVTARTAERAFAVETMGRDAGWLAAAATFGGAEILLVPEAIKLYQDHGPHKQPKEAERHLWINVAQEVAAFYRKNRNVIIAVAEGFEPRTFSESGRVKQFASIVKGLYGSRKKVGATELLALALSPALKHFFRCLSALPAQIELTGDVRAAIHAVCRTPPEGHENEVKGIKPLLPGLDVEQWLLETLRVSPSSGQRNSNRSPDRPVRARRPTPWDDTLLTPPPFKFELRPHRTDYLPRSGSPSAYDYKLATVLGQKVGQMLARSEFGGVPCLSEVVPYERLTADQVTVATIDEIRTLHFSSIDYFDVRRDDPEPSFLQLSGRINDFFRTITSGPENLDEAIEATDKVG